MIQEWLSKNSEYTRYDKTYKDEGKSGYHGDHLKGHLGLITGAIENGVIVSGDVLLVEAIDRLGRLETMDMISLVGKIVNAGVNIVTLQDGQTYSKERINSDSSCMYILIGKIQQAHDYSKSLSKRITKAWKVKREQAEQGENVRFLTPFWLTSDGKLIPERAEAVIAAIDLYLKGKGHRGILLALAGKYPELKSVHPSTLKRWFKHKALIGQWDHSRASDIHLASIKDVFEPLIDTATFYQLQSEAAKRTRVMGPETRYHLAGLVVCGECGSNYHFRKKTTKNDVIVYANCSRYLKKGDCTNNKSWPYEVLNQAFNDTYASSLVRVSENTLAEEYLQEQTVLEANIAELEAKLESAFDLAIQYPDRTSLKKNIDKLTSEQDEDKSRLALITKKLSSGTDVHSYSSYQQLETTVRSNDDDPLLRNKLLKELGYKIQATPERLLVECIDYGVFEYSIHKRSQKFGCYLVQVNTPEHQLPDEDGNLFTVEANSMKAAINRRDGLIESISDGTWKDLLHLMENPPQSPDIIYQSDKPDEYVCMVTDETTGEVSYGATKDRLAQESNKINKKCN
jgi:DNA invertase Pin-like site-specific DNA recombinase